MTRIAYLVDMTDVRQDLGLRGERGWTGAFTRKQADGCFANGSRVVKVAGDPGDANPLGATGRVLGSICFPAIGACYFIEWDSAPKVAVAVGALKLELAP